MKTLTYTVEGLSGKEKIRDYLKGKLHFSTNLIVKVKYGGVKVNGEIVTMRREVQNGDVVTVDYPEEDSENVLPLALPLTVLYEDADILVVDKPEDMPMHPTKRNYLPTLASAVRYYMGEGLVFRAITRLDRDTSGVVLVAKHQLASALLAGEIASGGMQKVYHALVVGTPDKEGVITAPIAREAEDSIKRVVRADGKAAVTRYRLLSSNADGEGNALVEVFPITGRTHQIRVHMAEIGHPLKNDFLYGRQESDARYRLRCVSLTFTHPTTGKRMTVTAGPLLL